MMRSKGWDAVIINGTDPHGSEYPAPRWKQVEWLTGFTGEAADVVITEDHAGLWTDSRYFIQAERQLDGSGVVLHKTRVPEEVPIAQWLDSEFPEGAVVAVDGPCFEMSSTGPLGRKFQVLEIANLLNPIWPDRPGIPQSPIRLFECGRSRESKISALRAQLEERDCDGIAIKALDDIAWLLNIRASDIEYNPLAISYLIVGRDFVKWFVIRDEDVDAGTDACFETLNSEGVEILPYTDFETELLSFEGRLYEGPSLVAPMKAVKNEFETRQLRYTHLKDGAAMEKFLFWLERSLQEGHLVSESDAARYLGECRAETDGYLGDSFETISAYGAGAALPHYCTPSEDAPLLRRQGLYLCDSGGQFEGGTTDITRTVPLGECTQLEREDYTLVLKAHIDLAKAVFPAGTPGCRIDAIARECLWASHRNFGHGTGHGVGFCLGVHEGPQDIRQNLNPTPLQPGMVVSDEPGIYREGLFGVRHENLLLCVADGRNAFGEWLRFETLTLCHFDTSALIADLLDNEEKNWLNAYNERVYRELSPILPDEICAWLKEKTAPVR